MTIIIISSVVAALAIVVVAVFMIPAIMEFRETVRIVRSTIIEVDKKLNPILEDVEKVAGNLKTITDATAAKMGKVEAMMAALGETGENVHKINSVISGLMLLYNRPATYWTGTKAAWKYVVERMKKKGG